MIDNHVLDEVIDRYGSDDSSLGYGELLGVIRALRDEVERLGVSLDLVSIVAQRRLEECERMRSFPQELVKLMGGVVEQ